jgi:hypothetical protein
MKPLAAGLFMISEEKTPAKAIVCASAGQLAVENGKRFGGLEGQGEAQSSTSFLIETRETPFGQKLSLNRNLAKALTQVGLSQKEYQP